jgi:hypothetical protein
MLILMESLSLLNFVRKGIKPGDYIKEFLVDGALTKTVKGAVQVRHERIDIFLRTLHGGEAAGVFAG